MPIFLPLYAQPDTNTRSVNPLRMAGMLPHHTGKMKISSFAHVIRSHVTTHWRNSLQILNFSGKLRVKFYAKLEYTPYTP